MRLDLGDDVQVPGLPADHLLPLALEPHPAAILDAGRDLHVNRLQLSVAVDLERQRGPAGRLLECQGDWMLDVLPALRLATWRWAGRPASAACPAHPRSRARASGSARAPTASAEQLIEHVPEVAEVEVLDAHP